MNPQPGLLISRYSLVSMAGKGAGGEVWEAVDTNLKRTVAIKILSPNLTSDAKSRERFAREARTCASLEHPGILPVYDFGMIQSIAYLVMPLLPGGTLESRIKSGSYTLQDAISWLRQAASALDFAHEKGIVHRDVKPANIMFDKGGRLYLTDFGIAKSLGEGGDLTTIGVILGTPYYMSPEQISEKPPGPKTDQYALGIVAFRLLTGHSPYVSDSFPAIIEQKLRGYIVPPSQANPRVPAGCDAVLTRVVAIEPEARFPSCTAFVENLARAIESARPEQAVETEYAPTVVVPSSGALTSPSRTSPSTGKSSGGVKTGSGGISGRAREQAPATPAQHSSQPVYKKPSDGIPGVSREPSEKKPLSVATLPLSMGPALESPVSRPHSSQGSPAGLIFNLAVAVAVLSGLAYGGYWLMQRPDVRYSLSVAKPQPPPPPPLKPVHEEPKDRVIKEMDGITTALIDYFMKNVQYPETNYERLSGLLAPKNLKVWPATDAWGSPYKYFASRKGKGFVLASAGEDKIWKLSDSDLRRLASNNCKGAVRKGKSDDVNADIIICNGEFYFSR